MRILHGNLVSMVICCGAKHVQCVVHCGVLDLRVNKQSYMKCCPQRLLQAMAQVPFNQNWLSADSAFVDVTLPR